MRFRLCPRPLCAGTWACKPFIFSIFSLSPRLHAECFVRSSIIFCFHIKWLIPDIPYHALASWCIRKAGSHPRNSWIVGACNKHSGLKQTTPRTFLHWLVPAASIGPAADHLEALAQRDIEEAQKEKGRNGRWPGFILTGLRSILWKCMHSKSLTRQGEQEKSWITFKSTVSSNLGTQRSWSSMPCLCLCRKRQERGAYRPAARTHWPSPWHITHQGWAVEVEAWSMK